MAADTADRLTEAVLLAVREHGFAGTSMQDLLRDAGVSSSSMYHFFPGGKEELVATAVRRSGLDAAARITDVFDAFGPEDAIRRIFAAASEEMETNAYTLGCPIGVPASEAPSDSEQIRLATADVFAAWTDAYATGLRKHGHDRADSESLARSIVAAYEGSVTLARATRSTQPYRDATDLIVARLASLTSS